MDAEPLFVYFNISTASIVFGDRQKLHQVSIARNTINMTETFLSCRVVALGIAVQEAVPHLSGVQQWMKIG